MNLRTLPFILALAAVVGCSKPVAPQRVVLDAFIEQYIHKADAVGAERYCVGDAKAKLESEAAAVAGQERPATFPDTEHSVVSEQITADSASFELELNVKSGGEAAFTRDLLVTIARVENDWKVVSFVFLR